MIAPPASLIDQIYRPMEGRGILETPEMLSGLDGLGGQLASIPGGPGAEQFPQAILDQGIHNRTGIEAGIAGMIPAGFGPSIMDPGGSGTAEMPYNPVTGYTGNNMAGPVNPETGNLFDLQNPFTPKGPTASTGQEFVFQKMFEDAGIDTDTFHSQSPSQQPAFFPQQPQQPQQPTGGFDSKAFANELLTGIGDLFKQHFPESAQMAFNNSNQQQSQIEQPIQDATTFDVQPQQNMAFNPFSVNTLGGSFGGGY